MALTFVFKKIEVSRFFNLSFEFKVKVCCDKTQKNPWFPRIYTSFIKLVAFLMCQVKVKTYIHALWYFKITQNFMLSGHNMKPICSTSFFLSLYMTSSPNSWEVHMACEFYLIILKCLIEESTSNEINSNCRHHFN